MENQTDFCQLIREELQCEGGASNLAFNEKIKTLKAEGHEIFHFGFGQSPFPVPAPFVRHLQDTAVCADYLPVAGLPELRKAIINFHTQWEGITLDIDGLVVGPGSKELIYLTLAVYRGVVWLAAPAWTTYKPQAVLAGHTPRILPQPQSQGWKLSPHTLEQELKGVRGPHLLIFTNPGNPSGCSYTREELEALVQVFRRLHVIVLSDEIYARLQFTGNHVCLAELYPEGTILTSGFSKWSSAGGWRLGYAHFPTDLNQIKKAVLSGASHTYSCAPAPLQNAVARAITRDGPELRSYILACRKTLHAVASYCQVHLSEVGVTGHVSRAGYYFMPDFQVIRPFLAARGIRSGQGMCDTMLREANVALMPSSSFLLGEDDFTTRFCFVNFEGGPCLEELSKRDESYTPDDNFVIKFCPELVKGVERIMDWVRKITNEQIA